MIMSTFLNRRVLVLNQSYEPIMVLGAKRAIILVLSKKVEAIETLLAKATEAAKAREKTAIILVQNLINTFNSENGSLKGNDDKQKNMISIENENANNNEKPAITNKPDKDIIETKKLKDNPKKETQSEQK